MDRLRIAFVLAVAIAPVVACERTSPPPNVLFIFVDDLGPRATGFEGNPVVQTPNIDRLASEGTVFSRAYVPIPQCAPSRAAVLTGRYPHETAVLTNREARLPENVPTFATLMAEAGYRRGLVGKWHLGDPDRPQAGFDDFWVSLDVQAQGHRRYFDPPLWVGSERREHSGYLPELLTDYAIEFIDRDDDRPFLLWLTYLTPHYPYVRPSGAPPQYRPADLTLPASSSDDLSSKPSAQRESSCHRWYAEAGDYEVRSMTARYYAMISALDRQIGRLLEHLAARGIENETLVVFTSDNGVLLGEHQMLTKGPVFYEEVVRMPLVFRLPGVVPAGRERSELVSSLDLLPTLASLAGVAPPGDLQGVDLWGLVRGSESEPVRDAVFFEYSEKSRTGERQPMLGMATARHKYVRYLADGAEELYDLGADPHELNNLAAAGVQNREIEDLRARLDRFQQSIADPFWP